MAGQVSVFGRLFVTVVVTSGVASCWRLGAKRVWRAEVPQLGPGEEPRWGSGAKPPEAEAIC